MSAAENPRAVAGDNSGETFTVAADRLKSFIERVESLDEEKAALTSDIKDIFAEAKGAGFDTKALRRILTLRKKDHAERQEEHAILKLYADALGMGDVFS